MQLDGENQTYTGNQESIANAHEQCEAEPFLTPGSIQPHGALIAFEAEGLLIRQVSTNTADWFARPHQALPGHSLTTLLPPAALEVICEAMEEAHSEFFPLALSIPCYARLHTSDGLWVLEIEAQRLPPEALSSIYRRYRDLLRCLQQSRSMSEMTTSLVNGLAKLLAMDQVVLYRFDLDGHGTVIAEARNQAMPSYLDQRFPASDVPQQVRRHAIHHTVRFTPDTQAETVPLYPAINPLNDTPLDQANCQLRSPHPWAAQYYRNMGVRGVLALSVVENDLLWGYVCALHREPLALDRELVGIADAITITFSNLIYPRELQDHQSRRRQLQTLLDQILDSLTQAEPWFKGFMQHPELVLQLMNTQGFVLHVESHSQHLGKTPNEAQISELLNWLNERNEQVFSTDTLGSHYPPAEQLRDTCTGLLAVSVSDPPGDWLLWFRPEVPQTVVWAGNPATLVKRAADGRLVVAPRDSFDRWEEQVEGMSLPFEEIEVELARELRVALFRRLLQVSREQQRHIRKHLHQVSERLDNLLSSLDDVIWQAEGPGLQLRYLSPQVESLTGYPPQAFLENPTLWFRLIHREDRERIRAWFADSQHDESFELEYRLVDVKGRVHWIRNRGRILHEPSHHGYLLEGIASEITDEKLVAQLQRQAYYDFLTGLPNRHLTLDRLIQLCEHLQRKADAAFSLLYLDINRFKEINDTLGHEVGDQALIHFARQLHGCLRDMDTVGRLGGDEFLVLLPDIKNTAEVVACARRIETAIAEPLEIAGQTLRLSTSIGILLANRGAPPAQELMRLADAAMYAAKRTSRLYQIHGEDDPLEPYDRS